MSGYASTRSSWIKSNENYRWTQLSDCLSYSTFWVHTRDIWETTFQFNGTGQKRSVKKKKVLYRNIAHLRNNIIIIINNNKPTKKNITADAHFLIATHNPVRLQTSPRHIQTSLHTVTILYIQYIIKNHGNIYSNSSNNNIVIYIYLYLYNTSVFLKVQFSILNLFCVGCRAIFIYKMLFFTVMLHNLERSTLDCKLSAMCWAHEEK